MTTPTPTASTPRQLVQNCIKLTEIQETLSFLSVPTHGRDYLTLFVQYLPQQPEEAEDMVCEQGENQGWEQTDRPHGCDATW